MSSSQRLTRDPWLDNAKMALVTLVVIGHACTLLPDDGLLGHFYDFLYAWHIPAFVFVAGYLSRTFEYTPERLWLLIRTVAVPYVVFECLMAFFRVYVGGDQLADLFTDPHWPLWFLTALIFWRLTTPVFRAPPAVVALAVAVGLCVWSGTVDGETAEMFDLTRAVGLLPFFVLGVHTTPERLERLRGPGARWLAGGDRRRAVAAGRPHRRPGRYPLALLRDAVRRPRLVRRARCDHPAGAARDRRRRHPRVPRAGAAGTRLVHPDGRRHPGRLPLPRLRHPRARVRRLRRLGTPTTSPSPRRSRWSAPRLLALALAAPAVSRRLALLVDPFGQAEQQVKQAVELSFKRLARAVTALRAAPSRRTLLAHPPPSSSLGGRRARAARDPGNLRAMQTQVSAR